MIEEKLGFFMSQAKRMGFTVAWALHYISRSNVWVFTFDDSSLRGWTPLGSGLYRTSLGGKVRFYSDKASKRMSFIVAWLYITPQTVSLFKRN